MRVLSFLLLIMLSLSIISGCVTNAQPGHTAGINVFQPLSTYREVTVHDTQINYRDLSTRSDAAASISVQKPASSKPDSANSMVDRPTSKTKKRNIKATQKKEAFVQIADKKGRSIAATPLPVRTVRKNKRANSTRIILHERDAVLPRKNNIVSTKAPSSPSIKTSSHKASSQQHTGFWQWLFGKRTPQLKPQAVAAVVPKPNPAVLNQPEAVMFKHAKTNQLNTGEIEKIIVLSQHANTAVVYEVRGTAGFLGKTAERIGRERAEFIKQALVNAGVSRQKIRVMDYDASYPGLRGIVTLRASEAT